MEEWCSFNKITLYVENIESIKRATSTRGNYEEITKKFRFNFYKKIMEKDNVHNIILGHHNDDIVENIFANIMRARCVLDLSVMKHTSVIDNVPILRPMINIKKDIVFQFAYSNNIPFFKDTTSRDYPV